MNRAAHCPINVAWLRLQAGTLRVDLDTCEVFSLVGGLSGKPGRWVKLVFTASEDREYRGQQCSGGYLSTKLRLTLDGVRYRRREYLHRIIWQAKHGQPLTPDDQIDHGAQGKPCNHWTNLERVTLTENLRRRGSRRSVEVTDTSWD